MSADLTDPTTRADARRVLDLLHEADRIGFQTDTLTGAEIDLIQGVRMLLRRRLGGPDPYPEAEEFIARAARLIGDAR